MSMTIHRFERVCLLYLSSAVPAALAGCAMKGDSTTPDVTAANRDAVGAAFER